VRRGRVQGSLLGQNFETAGVLMLRKRIEQIHHAFDHLNGGLTNFTRGFCHFCYFGVFHRFIVAILGEIAQCENDFRK
jgi:hypothetical protein